MEFNKLVFAGLAVGCIAAAGGGAYLAVRQNTVPQAIAAPSVDPASSAVASSAATVAGKPGAVTESEGLITPAAPAPAAPCPVQPSTRPGRKRGPRSG